MLALSATYPESLAQHLTRYMSEPTFVRLNPSDMGLKGKVEKNYLKGSESMYKMTYYDLYHDHSLMKFHNHKLETSSVQRMCGFNNKEVSEQFTEPSFWPSRCEKCNY